MIDIETLGTKPGCVILSIGAVEFGDDQLGREFYIEIGLADCQQLGLTIDSETVRWWMGRETKPPVNGVVPLRSALTMLADELSGWEDKFVWANSPSFDISILEAAYHVTCVDPPWSFRNCRDFRTAKHLLAPDFDPATVPSQGDDHNALADAKWQAKALMTMGYRG